MLQKVIAWCVLGFIAFIFAGAAVVGLRGNAPTSTTGVSADRCDRQTAYVMSHEFVRQKLLAPATARFPIGTDEATITRIEGCSFQVSSYVDSQNAFGAMIRSRFTVRLRQVGSTDRWEADVVTIH